jgi:Fic family protein
MGSTERLVPHLRATLAMDWSFPRLRPLLRAADETAFRETHAQEAYLARHDAPAHGGDAARSGRYLAALRLVRDLADAREPLTWRRLCEGQAEVLGGPVGFRAGDAFAHGGAHRYLWAADLEGLFRRKVEADARDGCPAVARAVRLYLDIAFFHPFADGNARAARLGLEYVLRAARVPTPALAPLVMLPKRPGDVGRYERCVRLVAQGVVRAGQGEGGER